MRINKPSQVQGIKAIQAAWAVSGLTDSRWLAYMLATAWHETAWTMQAIEEHGKGFGRIYGQIIPETGKSYYGRGLVQLTWADNYKRMSRIIYGDLRLYVEPELLLDQKVSIQVMFTGMTAGSFTGRKLSHYFNKAKDSPVFARKIINGLDKAELIAGYYREFLTYK